MPNMVYKFKIQKFLEYNETLNRYSKYCKTIGETNIESLRFNPNLNNHHKSPIDSLHKHVVQNKWHNEIMRGRGVGRGASCGQGCGTNRGGGVKNSAIIIPTPQPHPPSPSLS